MTDAVREVTDGRFGEQFLCQFEQFEVGCNERCVDGTGFCASHLGLMRERACEEIRESYGMCAVDICDGQADGSREAA